MHLQPGSTLAYSIPASGWGGRLWPKLGCNETTGAGCAVGDSVSPCPEGGCQPPTDTKIEFLMPVLGSSDDTWYDISLVDGYSLAVTIAPRNESSGSCVTTTCALSLDACPWNETDGIGDLRVLRDNRTVACLSPCKKWNSPAPYGLAQPETEAPGVDMCCPTPPIDVDQCRQGPVVRTQYVQLLRASCPTAYSYAYDDEGGLHTCPQTTSFDVTLCP